MIAQSNEKKTPEKIKARAIVENPSFSKYNVKLLSKAGNPSTTFSMYTDIKGIEEELENRNQNKINDLLYSPSSRPKQRLTTQEEREKGTLQAIYDGKVEQPFKTLEVKT